MSKINAVLLVVATSVLSHLACAATLDDLVDAQRAVLVMEAQKKLDASKPSPVTPVVAQGVGRSESKRESKDTTLDEARLVAVYGPISRLTAEISYRGAVFPVRQGGESVEGWSAIAITQSKVVLSKSSGGKKLRNQTIYLSDAAVNSTSAPAIGTGFNGMMPTGMSAYTPPVPVMPASSGIR